MTGAATRVYRPGLPARRRILPPCPAFNSPIPPVGADAPGGPYELIARVSCSGAAAAAPARWAIQKRKRERQYSDRVDQRRGEVPSFVVSREGSRGGEIEIPSPGVLSLFVHFLFARAKRKWTPSRPVNTIKTGRRGRRPLRAGTGLEGAKSPGPNNSHRQEIGARFSLCTGKEKPFTGSPRRSARAGPRGRRAPSPRRARR